MLCGVTEYCNHLVSEARLSRCAGVPLHIFPSGILVLTSVYHYGRGNRGNRAVVDIAVFVLNTGKRHEGPKTVDLGCEYLQRIIKGGIVGNDDRHLTRSETVCRIILIGEGIFRKEVTGLFKCLKTHL